MNNKRWVNIRPLFVVFVGLIFGILAFYGLCSHKLSFNSANAYFIVAIIAFSLTILFIVLGIVVKNNNKFFVVVRKHLTNFILFAVFIIVGFFVCSIKVDKALSYKTYEGEHVVTGKITQISKQDTYTKLVLEKVEIDLTETLDGKLIVNVVSSNNVSLNYLMGDIITFQGEVELTNIISDKLNLAKFSHGGEYHSYINAEDIKLSLHDPSIMDSLRQDIKDVLYNNMNEDNAGIVTGALLGEKDELSFDIKDTFSMAGVSHILAVSGLHVGVLVGLLLVICKLCKIKLKFSIIIICAVLLFYSALCSFTPSVLRASFMAIILLASKLLGERYDALSSLSLAGSCILILFPLDLFSVSFQLSFLCVFAIITLAPSLTALLKKIKLPKALAKTLSISICINVAIFPVCTNVFYTISLIGVIANIFVIPLFSIVYPILFLFTFICVILPFMNFIFIIPNGLVHILKIVVGFFGNITALNFKVFNAGYLIVFFVILFALVLQYLMVNKYVKGSVCAILFIVILGLFISSATPKTYTYNALFTTKQYSEESGVITTEDNKKILVGYDTYSTMALAKQLRVSRMDYWIIYNFNLNKIDEYIEVVNNFKIRKVIIPDKEAYNTYTLSALEENTKVIIVNEPLRLEELEIYFPTYNDRIYGVLIKQPNNNLLILDKLTENQFLNLNKMDLPFIDVLLVNTLPASPSELNFGVDNIIVSFDDKFEYNKILLSQSVPFMLKLTRG